MDQRAVSAQRGALVSVCGLLGLSLFKGAAGWLTGSKALLADACQSAADCAGSFASYLGWRGAGKKRNDPRQAEFAASIVLSALLLVAGLEMGISSVKAVAEGPEKAPGWGAVAAIAAGMAAREGLVRYKRRRDTQLGIRPDRPGENRSDIFASLTALVGASAAMAGDVLEMPVLYVLDPAAGLVVSVFVLRMGYRLTAGVLRQSDRSATGEVDTRMILEAVQQIDGVVSVDEIRTREHGHYIAVDAIIRVNPRISVAEGHDIAQRVRRHLTKRFLHIAEAAVQVQPYDPGYPYKTNHLDEEWSTVLQ
ncbi:cation diffusion facilitator family transporter [Cohnella sp. CFH 77786]|uniref:cation diffusion facilitator family transporter n=1 Tax=Cohnella sp. CFH 77786 TaxID=2662265 RepID=UPI0021067F90|nr:cation diffusion facilitator family transporter [Cohnella sp. CFH 77786]